MEHNAESILLLDRIFYPTINLVSILAITLVLVFHYINIDFFYTQIDK